MTLYKRGNIWWVTYMVDGVRYQQSTHMRRKSDAQAWVDCINTARKASTFDDAVEVLRRLFHAESAAPGIALDTAWDKYIDVARATGRDQILPHVLAVRKRTLARLVRWLGDNAATVKTVERITGPIAAKFAARLKDNGLKSKTRRNIIHELSTIWRLLSKVSPNLANPWGGLAPRDTDGAVGKAFSPDEEAAVFRAAEKVGKGWPAVCAIMRHTGLRYSDVARLRWDDFAPDLSVIRLRPHKTAKRGITVAIPVTAPVLAALGKLPRTGDFVLPVHAETYASAHGSVRKSLAFSEVLRVAGLDGKGYTVHSWRHTAATRLAATGADIETRKRLLGHRNDLTAARYDHAEHLAESRSAIERAANLGAADARG